MHGTPTLLTFTYIDRENNFFVAKDDSIGMDGEDF